VAIKQPCLVESRMPRLERRQQRTWRNRDERPLFATDCLRPARVVLDPRLPAESVPRPLQFILENPHVEVGTVGYSPTCDVEIRPPDHDAVTLVSNNGRRFSAIRQYENLKQFAVARAASCGVDADELLEGLVFSKLQLTGMRTFSSAIRKGSKRLRDRCENWTF
jgi:hypothetical protein